MNAPHGRSAALVAVLFLLVGCQSGNSRFLGNDIPGEYLKIGTKTDQPGTGWTADGYHFTGFDVDVATMVGNKLGFHETFVGVKSGDRVSFLTEHKVDLVVATFSITQERAKDLYFAGPYMKTYQGFLVRKNENRIRSVGDLNGKKVCAWEGSLSPTTLTAYDKDAQLVNGTNANDCLEKLRKGDADAVSTDQMILYGIAQQHSDTKVLPGVEIGTANYYGIAMAQHDVSGRSNVADCRRIRDVLERYVGTSRWKEDVDAEVPDFTKDPRWQEDDQPSIDDIDRLSCTRTIED